VLLVNEVTLGSVGVEEVVVGGLEKITFPNYLLHVVIALSYIRHIEKYDDIVYIMGFSGLDIKM
jgi:hypothetical protein